MTRRDAFALLWRLSQGAFAAALVASAGFAPAAAALRAGTVPPAAAPSAQPAPGAARVWFYRDYEPYESMSRPYVRINGEIVGISEPGGSFYRDLPPGSYRLTVDTWGTDVNQFPIVTLAAGEVIYAKVESLSSWSSSGGRAPYQRDTFYVRLIAPQLALVELRSHPYDGGR